MYGKLSTTQHPILPSPSDYLAADRCGRLIKRSAKLGRLFYHTALSLLAQVNPLSPPDSAENRTLQEHHAHHVCGIIAHTSDRAVASVAIRGLALTSTVLADRHERNEIITVLERIGRDTGWGIGKITVDLRRAWGREDGTPPLFVTSGIAPLLPAAGLLARDDTWGDGKSVAREGTGTRTSTGSRSGWGPSRPSFTRSSSFTATPSIPRQLAPLVETRSLSPSAGSPADFSHHDYAYQGPYDRPNVANGFHRPLGLWSG